MIVPISYLVLIRHSFVSLHSEQVMHTVGYTLVTYTNIALSRLSGK